MAETKVKIRTVREVEDGILVDVWVSLGDLTKLFTEAAAQADSTNALRQSLGALFAIYEQRIGKPVDDDEADL
jgi:hypothetical protein